MQAPTTDLHRTELPQALVLATSAVCGILAAMVAQILLARRGLELAGVWRELIAPRGLQLRAAAVWWIMAASGLLVGAAVAAVLSRCPLPWTSLRMLRWIAGAALVLALAHLGNGAAIKAGGSIGSHVGASLAALCAATLMSLFGAHFTAKRPALAALAEPATPH